MRQRSVSPSEGAMSTAVLSLNRYEPTWQSCTRAAPAAAAAGRNMQSTVAGPIKEPIRPVRGDFDRFVNMCEFSRELVEAPNLPSYRKFRNKPWRSIGPIQGWQSFAETTTGQCGADRSIMAASQSCLDEQPSDPTSTTTVCAHRASLLPPECGENNRASERRDSRPM